MEFYAASQDHRRMVRKTDSSTQSPPELIAFGLAVRTHRKALGYSQEAFGDMCGIDRSYMGGIERGQHNLALINILKIVRALKIPPSEFFKSLDTLQIPEDK